MFYVSSGDSHLRELYWNGVWHENDLTAETSGPGVYPYFGLTSFFDGSSEHVFYIYTGLDSHVHELYYNNSVWRTNDLTALTKGPVPYEFGGLTSFFAGSTEHVFYLSTGDYDVRELGSSKGAWYGDDPTAITHGPAAFFSSPLTGFFDGAAEHVFYVDGKSHVRELYWNGVWWDNDLTLASSGYLAAAAPYSLTSFFVP